MRSFTGGGDGEARVSAIGVTCQILRSVASKVSSSNTADSSARLKSEMAKWVSATGVPMPMLCGMLTVRQFDWPTPTSASVSVKVPPSESKTPGHAPRSAVASHNKRLRVDEGSLPSKKAAGATS